MSQSSQAPLIEVENLTKHFHSGGGLLNSSVETVRAVDDVSFDIQQGEIFSLVGESGSGKTTIGRLLMGLIEPTRGSINFDGTDIVGLSKGNLRDLRKEMQIVFQDPTSSLNPKKRIKDIISAPLEVHDVGSKAERNERVLELLDLVDLPTEFAYRYPKQLSGGQKQRVAIARALALNPKFIVLDEPTSALDVSVQANIIELLEDLQSEFGLTYLFITHDLSLVRSISTRVAVLYRGKIMEIGPRKEIFTNPVNPYTRTLLSAIRPAYEQGNTFESVERSNIVSAQEEQQHGCVFYSRCARRSDDCLNSHPPLDLVNGNEAHRSACYYPILSDTDKADSSSDLNQERSDSVS